MRSEHSVQPEGEARSALPAKVIEPPAAVSRFIYESDKLRKSDCTPRPGAFLPKYEKTEQRFETSVCCLNECDDDRVWKLARSQQLDKTLYARADVPVEVAVAATLSCIEAPVLNYDEHAVLINWPDDKESQKVITVALVAGTVQCLLPP